MNRFRKAYLALMGRLEPEVREIQVKVPCVGEPFLATLYHAQWRNGVWLGEDNRDYYLTCEQAHAEHPNEPIEKLIAVRIGGEYFTGSIRNVQVKPKPKRAKGKR